MEREREGGREGGREEDGRRRRDKEREMKNTQLHNPYWLDVDGHVVLEVHLLKVRGAGVNVTRHRKIKRHHHREEPLQE